MRSPVLDIIQSIIVLLDGTLTPTHPNGTMIALKAYQSVPENAADKYILVELVSEDPSVPQPKDRDMVDGVISIKVIERTKEDNAGFKFLREAMEDVQERLSPSFHYNVSSGSDGATITFRKSSVTQESQYNAGDGKVLSITLEVFYRAEYNVY